MSAVFGFFGSIIGAVVTAMVVAAGLTWLIILWKSGGLPEAIGWVTAMVAGFWSAVVAFFGFLGDLLTFAAK